MIEVELVFLSKTFYPLVDNIVHCESLNHCQKVIYLHSHLYRVMMKLQGVGWFMVLTKNAKSEFLLQFLDL